MQFGAWAHDNAKWLLAGLVLLLILGGFPAQTRLSSIPIQAVAFGEPLASAIEVAGTVYVSAADFANCLGYSWDWDATLGNIYLNSQPSLSPFLPESPNYHGHRVLQVVLRDRQLTLTPPALLYNNLPYVPLRLASEVGLYVGWHAPSRTAYIGSRTTNQLPRIGSIANLRKILSQSLSYPRIIYDDFKGAKAETAVSDSQESSAAPIYSDTNVQVAGVDESDIVKTDGNYIYQVRSNSVSISRAYPISAMAVLATIKFTDSTFSPTELFLSQDRLVVIGQTYDFVYPQPQPFLGSSSKPSLMPDMRHWPVQNQGVSALVYDISDRSAPQLLRKVELEGSYLTARKIDTRVVLLANKYLYNNEPVPPYYRDTVNSDEAIALDLSQVNYFPGGTYQSYLLTACFDLAETEQAATINAYLGAGNHVYMSESNLYVALAAWDSEETSVFKFTSAGLELNFAAKGKVPGHLLNQFSLDEYADHLRVATTSVRATQNNVYVMDAGLNIVGKVENIAPGERIYAARFMGNRGYLVTFLQVDPLFALDLSDPQNPRIVGALKIPGFSTYLHPIDEQHLLGIGRDTHIIERKDQQGRVVSTQVLEAGIKLAIFDVGDSNCPTEKYSVIVGGRGSHSAGLYNHKAILFDAERKLLALPISLTAAHADPASYGHSAFQGALIWSVDPASGIEEMGKITHLTDEQIIKSGYFEQAGLAEIQRVLLIDGRIYAISEQNISAHRLADLELLGSIKLP